MTQIQALCLLTGLGFAVLGWCMYRMQRSYEDICEVAARAGLHADAAYHEAQRAAEALREVVEMALSSKVREDRPEGFCATEGL